MAINAAVVKRMSSSMFLEMHFSEDLSWTTDTAWLATKAQKHFHKLKRAAFPLPIRGSLYRGTIESVTVWFTTYYCLVWRLHRVL